MADALKVLMLVKSQAQAFQKPTAAKRLRAKAKQSARMKRMAKGASLLISRVSGALLFRKCDWGLPTRVTLTLGQGLSAPASRLKLRPSQI
jgi:hypothetical protein